MPSTRTRSFSLGILGALLVWAAVLGCNRNVDVQVTLPAGEFELYVAAAVVEGPSGSPLVVSHSELLDSADAGNPSLSISDVDAGVRLRVVVFGFRGSFLASELGVLEAALPAVVQVVSAPAGDVPFPGRDIGDFVSASFVPPDARGGLDLAIIAATAGSEEANIAGAAAAQLQLLVAGMDLDASLDAGGPTDAGDAGADAGTDAGTDAGPPPGLCPVPDLFMVVTVTDDELDGGSPVTVADAGGLADLSLREALTIANNNGGNKQIWFDPVVFPAGDPATILVGGGSAGGVPLPSLTSGSTCLVGGAGAIVSGAALATSPTPPSGFRIMSAANVITDLAVVAFPGHGIVIETMAATGNTVTSCEVGHVGGVVDGNGIDGIRVANAAWGNAVGPGNIIGGNLNNGVYLRDPGTDLNDVVGNWVGIQPFTLNPVPNGGNGIAISAGASFTTIGGANPADSNWIGFSAGTGIRMTGPNTANNVVVGNYIGTDPEFLVSFANGGHGIYLRNGVHDITIGPGNHVGFNGDDGISVGGEFLADPQAIRVTGNLISLNVDRAIVLNTAGSNGGIAAPAIAGADLMFISGTAPMGAVVELYGDTSDEARCVLATGISTIAGAWSVPTPAMGCGGFLTAAATDSSGNTSELSAPVPFP